ncbi:MAG: 50S ribosomal protein L22 [Phycisphaeraceae bacterium]
MAYTSKYRMARISPKKARLVMDTIRGKRIDEAATILEMSKRRGAALIKGVLDSAIANADQAEANLRALVVTDARVDAGPTIKRFQPKDRGRAHPILKRTSHITIAVDVKAPVEA